MAPTRERIMLIGPQPPPYGGWAHVVASLSGAPFADAFDLVPFDTKLRDQTGPGKRYPAMIGQAARHVMSLRRALAAHAPAAVLLFTGPGGSFWRDLLLIRICAARQRPVILRSFGGRLFSYLDAMPAPLRRFALGTLRRSSAVLVETGEMVDQWHALAPHIPAYRVPNFVFAADLPAPQPAEQFEALYLGSMTPLKGVEAILAAVDAVCDTQPCTFHFVGGEISAGYLDHFRSLAARLRHADAVQIHGLLPRPDALALAGRCRAFLFPTRWPGEGQPAALIEAMGAGLVPIGTRWRGVAEIIDHETNGLLLDTPGGSDLAPALLRLIEDDALCRQLARQARQTILTHYEARAAVAQLQTIVSEVLSHAPPPTPTAAKRKGSP